MIMVSAFKHFWKGYSDFKGKSSRSQFWWMFLIQLLFFTATYAGLFVLTYTDFSNLVWSAVYLLAFFAYIAAILVVIIPNISLSVRRLRDTGFPVALIFVNLLIGPGTLIFLGIMMLPSKNSEIDVLEDDDPSNDWQSF
ncbi:MULTISPECIES: DUF805 domain-containing protein [Lactococcus]|uniref:DUF805 domain-containing protein n=2 Tax=Streptococcaceae TaxID=1300 RepID=UPI002040143E|nr:MULTISPECIES: DUF805 domain-containing protein [Lactococcus]